MILSLLGQAAPADEYRAETHALRVIGASATYHVVTPALRVVSKNDIFRAATPDLRVIAQPDAFRTKMPPMRIAAKTDTYRVRLPALRVAGRSEVFRAALPSLRLIAKTEHFRAKTSLVRVVAKSKRFRVAMPSLRVVARPKKDEADGDNTSASTVDDVICGDLRQCFDPDDIRREEANLAYLGYTPENYPRFCQDVDQSLGGCISQGETSGPSEMLNGEGSSLAAGLGLIGTARCLPFENYMIDLQTRSDAGEDVTEQAELLHLLMISAQNMLLQGRSDLWCAKITAGLP